MSGMSGMSGIKIQFTPLTIHIIYTTAQKQIHSFFTRSKHTDNDSRKGSTQYEKNQIVRTG